VQGIKRINEESAEEGLRDKEQEWTIEIEIDEITAVGAMRGIARMQSQ
jgi:hypothetical protein